MERSLDEIIVGEMFVFNEDTYLKVAEEDLYWFDQEKFYRVEVGHTVFMYPRVGYVAKGLC